MDSSILICLKQQVRDRLQGGPEAIVCFLEYLGRPLALGDVAADPDDPGPVRRPQCRRVDLDRGDVPVAVHVVNLEVSDGSVPDAAAHLLGVARQVMRRRPVGGRFAKNGIQAVVPGDANILRVGIKNPSMLTEDDVPGVGRLDQRSVFLLAFGQCFFSPGSLRNVTQNAETGLRLSVAVANHARAGFHGNSTAVLADCRVPDVPR